MFQMRAKMITVGLLGAAILLPIDLAKADQVGHASWYALTSRTASGEMMNPSELTAAHRSLPFGTRVLVENLGNGRSVVVRINDRGPFVGGRVIDLSKAAAASIGMIGSGVAKVRVTAAGGGTLAALGKAKSVEVKAEARAKVETSTATAQTRSASGEDRFKGRSVEPDSIVKTKKVASTIPTKRKVAAKSKRASTSAAAASRVGKRAPGDATRFIARTSNYGTRTAAKSRRVSMRAAAASNRPRPASRRYSRGSTASSFNPYAIPGFTKRSRS